MRPRTDRRSADRGKESDDGLVNVAWALLLDPMAGTCDHHVCTQVGQDLIQIVGRHEPAHGVALSGQKHRRLIDAIAVPGRQLPVAINVPVVVQCGGEPSSLEVSTYRSNSYSVIQDGRRDSPTPSAHRGPGASRLVIVRRTSRASASSAGPIS